MLTVRVNQKKNEMIAENWKQILAFVVSLFISLIILINGEEYLGRDYSPIMFSIFFAGAIVTGIWLGIKILADRNLEKILDKVKNQPAENELKEREKWAGRLEILNEELIFNYGEDQKIKIKISDLKVIGEFTTEADPIATDWFLVIVKKNNEVLYLPAYAVGLQDTLTQLSKTLNHEIVPKLFASVKFDSNVIYPKSIDGEKLFHLKGLNPKGIWEKIKVNMGFNPITLILRREIVDLID